MAREIFACRCFVSTAFLIRCAIIAIVLSIHSSVCAQEPSQAFPGKIYVQAVWERQAGDGKTEKFDSTIAIDPNTGEFRDLGFLGYRARVSPDGNRVAVSQQGAEVDGKSASDVHIIDTTNFETLHVVENASLPSWSGDGTRLVYNIGKMGGDKGEDVGWRGRGQALDLATKEIQPLNVPKTDEIDDWSADGEWVVTVSDRHPPFGRGYQLYAMHPDGSAQTRLTEGPGLNCYPRFCPRTNRIVYHYQRKGIFALMVVGVDGKHRRELMRSENGQGAPEAACWSPDGKWLAVYRFDWSEDAIGRLSFANHRLEIIDPNGKSQGLVNLAGASKIIYLGHPDWR